MLERIEIKKIFPLFSYWHERLKPIFCRHQMRYWDMKWYMDDKNSRHYSDWNGKIWKDVFCECQKCGTKYKMSMKPKEWGSWNKSNFTPTTNNFIEVEIFEFGHSETKRQKRDRIINSLLK